MIAHSINRVPEHTASEVNHQIRQSADENIRYFAAHPQWIEDRLQELDREWDVERMLEVNASTLSLLGLVLTMTVHKRFIVLPLVVQLFFLQHSLQGWCPPLPILRRMGFRTVAEIDRERYALKALRGDFDEVATGRSRDDLAAGRALRAVAR